MAISIKKISSSQTLKQSDFEDVTAAHIFQSLERRCLKVGLKPTSLRRTLLYALATVGDGATALQLWKKLLSMMDGNSPSLGSLHRSLRDLIKHGVLSREVRPDRVWCYRILCEDQPATQAEPLIYLQEVGSSDQRSLDFPDIADFFHHAAVCSGVKIRSVSITVESFPTFFVCKPT